MRRPGRTCTRALRAAALLRAVGLCSARKGRGVSRARAAPGLFASFLPHLRDGTEDRATEVRHPPRARGGECIWPRIATPNALTPLRLSTTRHGTQSEPSPNSASPQLRAETATKATTTAGARTPPHPSWRTGAG